MCSSSDGGSCTAEGAPLGWRHSLPPRVFVDDPEGPAAFLRTAFAAAGEFHADRPIELQIDDSILMLSGTEAREAMAPALGRCRRARALQGRGLEGDKLLG